MSGEPKRQPSVVDLPARLAAKRLSGLPHTDIGNAERLLDLHGDDLRFAPGLGWLVWDGRRWARDDDGAVMRRAKLTVQAMRDEAARLGDDGKDLYDHAGRFSNLSRLKAAVELAASDERAVVRPEELDPAPDLLTVDNGTVDLRTGELRAHDRGDLITKLAPVPYNPDARDERWDRFVAETTAGDVALAEFLQRAVGYSLTGSTSEEVFFLAHGPTATGKSTFLEAVKATLGDYGTTADFETFLQGRNGGGPRSGLAQLVGARFVVSIEADEGRSLAKALTKTITGGDTVRASFLYRDSFEFVPRFKLWLATNHVPEVSDADDAIWRRILRLPFDQQVPANRCDRSLKAHLREPNAAVLAWAVRGCLEWHERGLGVPDAVRRSTAAYREDMDPLRDFLADRCVVEPSAIVPSRDLWAAYEAWVQDTGESDPMSREAFARRLKRVPCEQTRLYVDGNQARAWRGIALRDSADETEKTAGQ